ncbi:MAG: S1C family serine protease, partial [Acidimicrobiales bacterium]
ARLLAVGSLSGVIAALITTSVAIAIGPLRTREVRVPVVERIAPPTLLADLVAVGYVDVVAVAERVRPTVVHIQVNGRVAPAGTNAPPTTASGVLFRSDGMLVTSHHAVDGARSITVVLYDGRELAGRLVGSDAETDIAVVDVEADGLPTAALGTAAHLRVGQPAIAVGSPVHLPAGPSVTVGVVSALGQRVNGRNGPLLDMIQTDAPVAPGTSGGALVDQTGTLIGIATAAARTEAGAEGIGYAIPVDMARTVTEQLATTGKFVHPWLGIDGDDVDPATTEGLGLSGGALVRGVRATGPGEAAGLAPGDIITAVNGRPVTSMASVKLEIRRLAPGEWVELSVARSGRVVTVPVRLAERPREPQP